MTAVRGTLRRVACLLLLPASALPLGVMVPRIAHHHQHHTARPAGRAPRHAEDALGRRPEAPITTSRAKER